MSSTDHGYDEPMADQIVADARHRAALILEEARQQAEDVVEAALLVRDRMEAERERMDASLERLEAEREQLELDIREQAAAAGQQYVELATLRQHFASTLRAMVQDFADEIDRVERTGGPRLETHAVPDEPALPELARAPARLPGAGESVQVEIGPLRDFAAVASLEDALNELPEVLDVYVRRFAAERVTLELALSPGTEPETVLARVLPDDCALTDLAA
jgi:hypothetical protein